MEPIHKDLKSNNKLEVSWIRIRIKYLIVKIDIKIIQKNNKKNPLSYIILVANSISHLLFINRLMITVKIK